MWVHLIFIVLIISSFGCTIWLFKWDRKSETIYAASSTLLAIIKLFPRKVQKIMLIILFSLITISIIIFYIVFIMYR